MYGNKKTVYYVESVCKEKWLKTSSSFLFICFNKSEKTFFSVPLFAAFCQHVPTWQKKNALFPNVEFGGLPFPCIVGALSDVFLFFLLTLLNTSLNLESLPPHQPSDPAHQRPALGGGRR